ncbi:hypothetical protein DFP72DRAFT_1085067 [Ephemerocybe angulata]|uniref:Uncharacterized protein n=1 Tax=Ephemerocybe angulata TaxID=980116 RepID=A0A8H6H5Z2_9AGAR|nr:hypothetical protein DFP72DRAFT_1085067 [Tulosesus angulatus]
MFQYPYSHSTYFTRSETEYTSELPPMNSFEDILQIQFMHDRMMAQEEDDRFVVWNRRISRFTKDIKRGFRTSLQAIAPNKKSKRRLSTVSWRSSKDPDTKNVLE